jgi:molecular chaperone IbpA
MEDVAMNTFDFEPLWRSTVGFDRLFDMLNNPRAAEAYPPYDIARTGEDNYRISLAVAGFSQNEITITAQQNVLLVSGKKERKSEGNTLYQGISSRSFERRFDLADHVEVAAASMENGLLQIDLVRRIPEAMKPRRIEIQSNSRNSISQDNAPQQLEQNAA